MTRLFGVLGDPVDHSLSPVFHEAAYRALGIDAVYGRFEIPKMLLRRALDGLIRMGGEGFNLTVPLKEAVIPLLDRIDPEARAMGAVNTLVLRRGKCLGFNTDGAGFRQALVELGWRPGPTRAVILGAGGSARAVAWELSRAPGSSIMIANRTPRRAHALARWLRPHRKRSEIRAAALEKLSLDGADVLVNTTTVGMSPRDGLLIDPRALRKGMIVYDLVYHRTTALIEVGRRRGCVAVGGLSMLLYQGAAAFRLWFDLEPPIAAMRRALEASVHSRR